MRPSTSCSRSRGESVRIAGAAWSRAARARRRRWAGLAVAGVAVLAAVLLVPPAPSPGPPLPTEVPDGVTVLPAVDDLMAMRESWQWGGPPPHLLLRPSDLDGLASLASAPLPWATLVAATSDGGLALAGHDADGLPVVRLVEGRRLPGARLVATSLSPDGTVVALPAGGDLVLVEVPTGRVRRITVGAVQPEPPVLTWLDSSRIILPGPQGALVVNLTTNEEATGTVITVTRINVDTQVSVADLVGSRCPWCGGPLTVP